MPEIPHDRKIAELAGAYKRRGYAVLENPSPGELPPFLQGHQPDLIATSPADNVVIEVKSRASLRQSDQPRRLADAVAGQTNWRFELVLLKPEEEQTGEPEILSLVEIQKYLDEATSVGHLATAFILAWVAGEASLRAIAKRDGLSTMILSPKALLKELVFEGVISRERYKLFDDAAKVRARVVHGLREPNLTTADVNKLIEGTKAMIEELSAEPAPI